MTISSAEQFFDSIMIEFYQKCHEYTSNNWDYERYPREMEALFLVEKHLLHMKHFITNLARYYNIYSALADPESKSLYRLLILYRLLGQLHVKLPFNTPEHWEVREKTSTYRIGPGPLGLDFMGSPVDLYSLIPPGSYAAERTALTIETTRLSLYWSFFSGQYFFDRNGVTVMPEPGDVVIDAGSCLGDNCLSFALRVGDTGHVYAFDFVDIHLRAIAGNVERNAHLRRRVTVMPVALGDECRPGMLAGNGNAARGDASLMIGDLAAQVAQETIDHLVETGRIARIDYIKMDIEGYELRALTGAEQSLRRFRPKLAISIYHLADDFVAIQEYLASLDLGYKFYIDHYTIHHEETVLYARSETRT